jgi:DNA-binding beta-propeller fold protein YncE
MKIRFTLCVFLSCVGLAILSPAASASEGVYRLSRSLHVGGEGTWDYLAVDEANRHLFVSHATQVEVIDFETGKPIAAIKDTPGVHGIAIASKSGRGFISCGKSNNIAVFDLKTFAVTSRIPAGEGPDAIMFDSVSNRVFAMNGHGSRHFLHNEGANRYRWTRIHRRAAGRQVRASSICARSYLSYPPSPRGRSPRLGAKLRWG